RIGVGPPGAGHRPRHRTSRARILVQSNVMCKVEFERPGKLERIAGVLEERPSTCWPAFAACPFAPHLPDCGPMQETLRVWTETLETFVLEVILEERPGKRAAIVRFLLALLSRVFAIAVKVRRF